MRNETEGITTPKKWLIRDNIAFTEFAILPVTENWAK